MIACFLTVPLAGAQFVDVPPDGTPGKRVFEGGSETVPIDTRTPLVNLIQRLESDWELVMTGKAYWIGYTDDMYSIAAHKEASIPLLLNLIETTDSPHTASSAVLTIHLIGIESTIVGRYVEEFKSREAREALFSFVGHENVGALAVMLLARDPWQEDLPVLVRGLRESEEPDVGIINALFRYETNGIPFRQNMRERRDRIPVFYENASGRVKIGELVTEIREGMNQDPAVIDDIDRATMVFHSAGNGRIFRRLELESNAESLPDGLVGRELNDFLEDCFRLSRDKVDASSYIGPQYTYWHYIDRGQVIIVDAAVAKQRWLTHFERRSA